MFSYGGLFLSLCQRRMFWKPYCLTPENSHKYIVQKNKEKENEKTQRFNEIWQLPTSLEKKGREILFNLSITKYSSWGQYPSLYNQRINEEKETNGSEFGSRIQIGNCSAPTCGRPLAAGSNLCTLVSDQPGDQPLVRQSATQSSNRSTDYHHLLLFPLGGQPAGRPLFFVFPLCMSCAWPVSSVFNHALVFCQVSRC